MKPEHELEQWLATKTGIELSRGGVTRVLGNVVRDRCHALGCDPSDYVRMVNERRGRELEQLVNAVTVVYTWFFRDRGQLAALQQAITEASSPDPLRIWVPGCATGEDAYSIALLASQVGRQVMVLGTDINTNALDRARQCRFKPAGLREVDKDLLRHFENCADGKLTLRSRIREQVNFAEHNLVEPVPSWAGSNQWDIILCRNVLIYFQQQRALQVLERMVDALRPAGMLFLGAGEVLYDVPDGAQALYVRGRLALQKLDPGAALMRRALNTVPEWTPPPLIYHHPPVPALPPRAASITVPPPAPKNEPQQQALQSGHTLLDQGRVTEALAVYQQAAALNPTCADAQLYQGVAYYLAGELTSAAHHLRAALFLDDQLWPAAFYLALSYESMGLVPDALREFRHLLRIGASAMTTKPHPFVIGWHSDIMQLAESRLKSGELVQRLSS